MLIGGMSSHHINFLNVIHIYVLITVMNLPENAMMKSFRYYTVLRFISISILPFVALGVHAATLHVDCHNPAASDDNKGSLQAPYKTINAAAQVARSGDTVLVHPGVYREHIAPGKDGSCVTYKSAKRHQAIVRGSEVWTPKWKSTDIPGFYQAQLDSELFKGRMNPYLRTISIGPRDDSKAARPIEKKSEHWPLTLGQIFVDGQPMTQLNDFEQVRSTTGCWIVGHKGKSIYLHMPRHVERVEDASIELTIRDRIFAPLHRGLSDIAIEGFIMEHCANQGPFPQAGIISVRSGKAWRIQENIVRYAKTMGIDIGSETWDTRDLPYTSDDQQKMILGGQHLVLNNLVEDNGLSGIAGWSTAGTRIVGNTIRRNNRLGFQSKINAIWEEDGGIKVHSFDNGVIEGNLVINNEAAGIWIDNGYKGARISRNFVSGSLGKGIFVELGEGRCLIDNNIVAYTRSYSNFYGGDGIYSHDASDLIIVNNLLYHNARHGVLGQVVSDRKLGADQHLVECSRHNISGNLFIGNNDAAISMPLPSKLTMGNRCDYNVFIGHSVKLRRHKKVGHLSSKDMGGALAALDIPDATTEGELSLEQWKEAGYGKHSKLVEPCRMTIAPGNSIFHAMDISKNWALLAPLEDDVTKDYFGNQIDADGDGLSTAGPFSKLPPGENRWVLWPIRQH